jgi:hypothetical protein
VAETRIATQFADAFRRLVSLPGLGVITTNIWAALDFDTFGQILLAKLIEKTELTERDGQVHSFMVLLPTPEGLTTAVFGMVWPRPLSESRELAKQSFANNAPPFLRQDDVAGALQLDLFLGGPKVIEVRLAWQASPSLIDRLPEELRTAVYPWGTGKDAAAAENLATGTDIIALAEAAWNLCQAMEERQRKWPDENGPPPMAGFTELRAPFKKLVPSFNNAVKRVGLEHTMPLEDSDPTWRPHNIANALRFGSIVGSLKAELRRVWGSDACDRFIKGWQLFQDALPMRPLQESLDAIAQPALIRNSMGSPAILPGVLDAFISYAWSDKTRGARDIYEMIASSGRSAWLDEEQRPDSLRVDETIAPALLRANAVVVCLSTEMLTRAGYALREILIAVSWIPERCILARLDKIPVPPFLSAIRVVDWYEPMGPADLMAALPPLGSTSAAPLRMPTKDLLRSEKIDSLVASVERSHVRHRGLAAADRKQQLELRGRLSGAVLEVWRDFYPKEDWNAILALGDKAAKLIAWSTPSGSAGLADPTIFGASIRLRSALFKAHVQLAARRDWDLHNKRAYDILEEVLNVDPELFRPARELGWLPENCRLAAQDCLDTLKFAQEWFLGWSPDMLVTMCNVSAASAATVERRMQHRFASLAEIMLGLRAFEDRQSIDQLPPPWGQIWISLHDDLRRKLQVGAHPATKAYFEELSRWIDRSVLEQLTTAMADGLIDSLQRGSYREEIIFDVGTFVLRCVVRSYKATAGKHESVATVHGTVLKDLRESLAKDADLNILLSTFTRRSDDCLDWNYVMYLNCLANENSPRRASVPHVLRNPFVMAEMLTKEELTEIGSNTHAVYEEVD